MGSGPGEQKPLASCLASVMVLAAGNTRLPALSLSERPMTFNVGVVLEQIELTDDVLDLIFDLFQSGSRLGF